MRGEREIGNGGALVGREPQLSRVLRVLEAGDGPRVVFIHGPGGIGKSALLEEALEAAASGGESTSRVDARDLALTEGELDERLGGAGAAPATVIALDSFELVEGSGSWLLQRFLPGLASDATLILAGRNPPGREWMDFEALTEVRLGPLDGEASLELLDRFDVDRVRRERIVEWAGGHPLALELAGRLASERADWVPAGPDAPDELIAAIVRRLGEVDVDTGRMPVLTVAALARSTTPALLVAALPDHDGEAEWSWLSSRSFTEPVGRGVALHGLLAEAVRAELRGRDPLLEIELKRRIADHAYEMAQRTGELARVLDLSHLIENPGLRWGFVVEASASFYPDAPRPGDAEAIDRAFEQPGVEPVGGGEPVWRMTRELFVRMPELGVVVRDRSGEVVGFTFVPSTAADDPDLEASALFGPCLRDARTLEPRGETLVMPYMCDLTGNPASGIIGMLANTSVLRSSRANPRYAYMTINPQVEIARLFAETSGAERRPTLDLDVGEPMEAWLLDFGPGGFLAHQRELVYRELGINPPERPPEENRSVRGEEVRDALRAFDRPADLASSPLAEGDGAEDRARAVRRKLEAAIDRSFGNSAEDRALREVIAAGYLERNGGHGATAQKLYLSRATYFRRLRKAVDRIAENLSESG